MSAKSNEGEVQVVAVVATMGKSPVLDRALEAITKQPGTLQSSTKQARALKVELVVVTQGTLSPDAAATVERYADRVVQFSDPLGFAAANNKGLGTILAEATPGTAPAYIALINDDAIVEEQWVAKLIKVLEKEPKAAAAQGTNFLAPTLPSDGSPALPFPKRVDGMGIQWQRQQAVQIGHGSVWSRTRADCEQQRPTEIFGVSATAALFRADALQQVSLESSSSRVFDERLRTYYEDVDLACRLRRAGWTAWLEPTTACEHHASSSAPKDRKTLLVRNRHLVLARHLGRAYFFQLPWLLARDVANFGTAALPGWASGLNGIGHYLNFAPPIALEIGTRESATRLASPAR